ncbi:hypothetical protein WCX18_12190 [Sulfurimonas sp. HSL1-2]|uniref:hypothetical protein n=1 Tax=Thiomicrolovo zhangzhouensis TaxID=3131933 RepID=UPI0031F821A7
MIRMIGLAVFLLAGTAFAADAPTMTKQVLETKKSVMVFYRAEDEMAVSPAAGASAKRVVAVAPAEVAAKTAASGSEYRRVFYTSERRSERNRFIATGNVLVRLQPGTAPETFAAGQGFTLLQAVNASAGIYLFAPAGAGELIGQTNRLNTLPEVDYAEPEWIKPVLLR